MLIYIIILLILLLLTRIENTNIVFTILGYKIKGKVIVEICACSLIVLLSTLRSKLVGGDLVNYERSFEAWRTLSLAEVFKVQNCDIGFVLLNWLVGKFSDSFYTFMVVVSVIILVLILKLLIKYSFNVSYSLFLYICIGQLSSLFSGLRQALAGALVLYSLNCFIKKEKNWFYVYIIMAASIHRTAIVGLLLYWIICEKRKRQLCAKYLVLAMTAIIIAVLGIPFVISLYQINNYSALYISGSGYKFLLFRSFIVFIFAFLLKTKVMKTEVIDILFKAYIIGTILQVTAIGFSVLTRLTTYFCVGIIIWLPNIIHSIHQRKLRNIGYASVTIIGILYWLFICRNDTSGIIPYQFFWK